MNAVIIAIALISGYIFSCLHLPARYGFKRAEGWDAYFYLATIGVFFTAAAWFICTVFNIRGGFRMLHDMCIDFGIVTHSDFQRVIPIAFSEKEEGAKAKAVYDSMKYAFFGLVSMTLAALAGGATHLYYKLKPYRKIKKLSKMIAHNPVESIINEAIVRQKPLLICTNSRKFYIGLVQRPKYEHGRVRHISVLPLLSGYRANSTLKTRVTTNYRQFFIDTGIGAKIPGARVTIQDFNIVLPVDEMTSLSFVDIPTFEHFREIEKAERIPQKKS